MRKRLKAKLNNRGFTLAELLVVVGILALACAIAVPSVLSISAALRFRQCNDHAGSIFLAVQQNLTLLRAGDGLRVLEECGGAEKIPLAAADFPEGLREEYVYTTAGTEAFELLLPAGSVEETVRAGEIIVEYSPQTGNIFSVFYSTEPILEDYLQGKLPRDEQTRKGRLLGYHQGSDLLNEPLEIGKLRAAVEYSNGEEGIVTVRVPMPEACYGAYSDFASALEVTLTITGEQTGASGSFSVPAKAAGDSTGCTLAADGRTVEISFAIDSLRDGMSFANFSSGTQQGTGLGTEKALTALKDESLFPVLPGENITIRADVEFEGSGEILVEVEPGILSGVNPMFQHLLPGEDGYILTVSNGRNLQNLNALSPTIAAQIRSVVFTADIHWDETAAYYHENYGTGPEKTYSNAPSEAPGRALPYFVPICNPALFGTARFSYPDGARSPVLTETAGSAKLGAILGNDQQLGDGVQIYGLNIDTTHYVCGADYYAGTPDGDADRFTGLFGYVNTAVENIQIVNPIIRGYCFRGDNNPATGALTGAAGSWCALRSCGVYLDVNDEGFSREKMAAGAYDPEAAQNWYGVSGEGAVGGLVGYGKALSMQSCFAAVEVSGNLRDAYKKTYWGYDKDFGYSNGIGGLVGNAHGAAFEGCYASGNVLAAGCNGAKVHASSNRNDLLKLFGTALELGCSGGESAGAGGFVGTSHGSRYENCFATGNVTATSPSGLGAGGFVGILCVDDGAGSLASFTGCYSVGLTTLNSAATENFSGGNARAAFDVDGAGIYLAADYYRLYAPYYTAFGTAPDPANSLYLFRDCYYLNYGRAVASTESCVDALSYEALEDLPGIHTAGSGWIESRIQWIKNIPLALVDSTYEERYFEPIPQLTALYRQLYAENYSGSIWEAAAEETTHGYNVGGAYPFSKLAGMDYYGDWPAKPSDIGLVYYETYQDGKTCYYFDKARPEDARLKLRSDEGAVVVSDGYGVFSASKEDLFVTVGSGAASLKWTGESFLVDGKNYYSFRFTDALMAQRPAEGEFYLRATAAHEGGSDYIMYVNPGLALTHVNPAPGYTRAAKPASAPEALLIRSARQFAAIGSMADFWDADCRYIQQLNIDASIYEWSGENAARTEPIGTEDIPFEGCYTAGGRGLSGFCPKGAGLFGVVGDRGRIEDWKVTCGNLNLGSETAADAAVVAGCSSGSLRNVAVDIRGDVTLTAGENGGLLAGRSSGEISGCTVTVRSKVTIQAPNAGALAGLGESLSVSGCGIALYAVFENRTGHMAGAVGILDEGSEARDVSVALSGGSIAAEQGWAAGFALEISGIARGSSVTGTGTISGKNAAGFTALAAGAVEDCRVTPARSSDAAAYLGSSNSNLTVAAEEEASGFAGTAAEGAVLRSCESLCRIAGGSSFGFVGRNAGVICGCSANVDQDGGFAFAGSNENTISNCYGWYGNGIPDDHAAVQSEITRGLCQSSYFADRDVVDLSGIAETPTGSVVLYQADGTMAPDVELPSQLREYGLARLTDGAAETLWSSGEQWEAYPYTVGLGSYGYPVLSRPHCGDWVREPSFAYGIAYYETYTDGTLKLRLEDLSDWTQTIESGSLDAACLLVSESGITPDSFDRSGQIQTAGYALFCRSGQEDAVFDQVSGGEALSQIPGRVLDTPYAHCYSFYELEGAGLICLRAADGKGIGAADLRFACAMAEGSGSVPGPYEIRTAAQLAHTGSVSASFIQTHDITISTEQIALAPGESYDGGGCTLTVTGDLTQPVIASVEQGAVRNLRISAERLMVSLIGTMAGGELSDVDITTSGGEAAAFAGSGLLVDCFSGGTIRDCDLVLSHPVTIDAAQLAAQEAEGVTVFAFGGITGVVPQGAAVQNCTLSAELLLTGEPVGQTAIGGAVGYDIGGSYTNVRADVKLTGSWSDGFGPVGMFAGFTKNGSFRDCASSAENSRFWFIGEAARTVAALEPEEDTDWFRAPDSGDITQERETAAELEEVAAENGFAPVPDGTEYGQYAAVLDGCRFLLDGVEYTQKIRVETYFFRGSREEIPGEAEDSAGYRYRFVYDGNYEERCVALSAEGEELTGTDA